MAVIGSIRKRGTLVMVVIGVSLVAFIVGDWLTRSLSGAPSDTTIAIINGTKVNVNEYSNRLNEKEAFIVTVNPEADLNEMQRQQMGDEVWADIIRDYVYYKQYELLGLGITKEEMEDMLVGETVHPSIRSQFINQQTGLFDPNMVAQYSSQFEDESAVPDEQREQWIQARTYWAFLQKSVKEDRIQTKYNNLISKGLYVTTKEGKSNFVATNTKANMRFVFKPYSSIPDSTVTISEDELKEYYNTYKYKFRQKKSRSLKYVMFTGIPTSGDSAALLTSITQIRDEWEGQTDDTLYVYENADDPFDPTYVRRGGLGPQLDSLLFDAENGTIAGPIVQNGSYIIGRKISDRMMSDSVKARHILLQPKAQEDVERMLQLRDSLYTVLENGGNFAEIAAMYSADGSAQDTGNLGWFTQGMMVQQFNDTCFASNIGDLKKVDTQFGFHIVYIQDKTEEKKQTQVALINRQIQPSDETMKVAYSDASEFAFVDQEAKDFDSDKYFADYTLANNLVVRDEPFVTEGTKNLMGLDGTKDIIKWSLTAKRGDISDIFQTGNTYIVALLTSVRVDGIPKLEDIRGEVEVKAKQHKKAEQFIQEFTGAMGSANNIDGLAQALNLQVMQANDVAFGSFFIPGAGIEPSLLGALFGSQTGQLIKPVEGNNGVFVAVMDVLNPAPEMPDYTMNRMQILQALMGRIGNEVGTTLQEKAKVQDLRYKFDF